MQSTVDLQLSEAGGVVGAVDDPRLRRRFLQEQPAFELRREALVPDQVVLPLFLRQRVDRGDDPVVVPHEVLVEREIRAIERVVAQVQRGQAVLGSVERNAEVGAGTGERVLVEVRIGGERHDVAGRRNVDAGCVDSRVVE